MSKKGMAAAVLISLAMTTAASPAIYVAGDTENNSEKQLEPIQVTQENSPATPLRAVIDEAVEGEQQEETYIPACIYIYQDGENGEKLRLYCDSQYDKKTVTKIDGTQNSLEPVTLGVDEICTLDNNHTLTVSKAEFQNAALAEEVTDQAIQYNAESIPTSVDTNHCYAVSVNGEDPVYGSLAIPDYCEMKIENAWVLKFIPFDSSKMPSDFSPEYVYLNDCLFGILLEDTDVNNVTSYYVYTRDEWGTVTGEWETFLSTYGGTFDGGDKRTEETTVATTEEATTATTEEATTVTTTEMTLVTVTENPDPNPLKDHWRTLLFLFGAIAVIELAAIILLLLSRKPKKAPEKIPDSRPEDSGTTGNRKLICTCMQDIGKRPEQQDSYGYIPVGDRGILAVVADGMGGLKDGDKVSQFLVKSFRNEGAQMINTMPAQKALLALLMRANTGINQILGESGNMRSGSTLLAVWAEKGGFNFISVGDSHIYLIHQGRIYQVNREHIYETELHLKAVNREITFPEMDAVQKKGGLTSFVGMGQLKYVDESLSRIPFDVDDKILLMSDGVFNTIKENEILSIVEGASDMKQASENMKAAILRKNYQKQDNFTCLIISYQEEA